MNEQDFFFVKKGIHAGDAIEVPYASWVLWGHPQETVAIANPMPENRGGIYYEGWVRLSRSPFVRMGVESIDPATYTLGDTPIELPEGFDFAGGAPADKPAFTFERNEHGRLSHLRFPHISAPSIGVALQGVRGLANQVVWSLSVASHQPLFVDGILVRSMDEKEVLSRSNSAAPDIQIGSIDPMVLTPALRPFMSQYVEGIRSSSSFYSFLCFYKVCEAMNSVRSKLRKIFEKHQLAAPALNGVFPEDPIGIVYKGMVGKKYTSAVTEFYATYRNGIAHFRPGDKLEPLVDLKLEAEIGAASCVMRWAASDLIEQATQALSILKVAGVDVGAISFT